MLRSASRRLRPLSDRHVAAGDAGADAFSLLLEPLQNAVSRRFERQCDRYALARTSRREAYISAFQKLARLNKDDPAPHPLEVFWFHSHPPIGERLAVAEKR